MQNEAGKGRVKPHSHQEVTKHPSRAAPSAAAEPSAQEEGNKTHLTYRPTHFTDLSKQNTGYFMRVTQTVAETLVKQCLSI